MCVPKPPIISSTLLHKLSLFTWGHEPVYMGYLTPQEILVLFDLGCKDTQKRDKRHAPAYTYNLELQAKGIGGGSWFYFFPTKEILSKIPDPKAPKKPTE